jgi:cytochrome b561
MIGEWLATPVDPERVHEVGFAVSWHARIMVLGWGFLAPVSVLIARFFKVLPGQDFPRELDTQFWWHTHWIGFTGVLLLTIFGVGLLLPDASGDSWHGRLGYCVLTLVFLQVALGIFRGTKGGPTAPASDGSFRGDHYSMTPWRTLFEACHKSLGYLLLLLSSVVIVLGLWDANAPNWMWIVIGAWWALLICAAFALQLKGLAVDTYQAIWGPDPSHPGNKIPPKGWGMRRIEQERGDYVRRD